MSLWRRHPRLVVAFVLAAAVTLFFVGRLAVQAVYWSDPAHRMQPVAGWMTVGYVARSWGLDPRAIDARAGTPLPQGHPLTLEEIAAARGVPVSEVIAAVEAAVEALRAEAEPAP